MQGRAKRPIVRPCDNWIKVIIEFLGSKMENLVSLDWNQRGVSSHFPPVVQREQQQAKLVELFLTIQWRKCKDFQLTITQAFQLMVIPSCYGRHHLLAQNSRFYIRVHVGRIWVILNQSGFHNCISPLTKIQNSSHFISKGFVFLGVWLKSHSQVLSLSCTNPIS